MASTVTGQRAVICCSHRSVVAPGLADTRTLAHELGHMLLNTGGHSTEFHNLMNDGSRLNAAPCTRMGEILTSLYSAAEVPDPGPPT